MILAVERHQRTPAASLALDAERVAVALRGMAVVAAVDLLRAHVIDQPPSGMSRLILVASERCPAAFANPAAALKASR